jgi:hypothetical protein
MYRILYQLHTDGLYTSPWLDCIRNILTVNGLGNIWTTQSFPNVKWLGEAVKLRLQDQYKQEWHQTVENSPKCTSYRLFKEDWGLAKYLLVLPRKNRIVSCKFRASNHKLAIEKGRHRGIPRHERICNNCTSNSLGDEFHFLIECPALRRLRTRYIPLAGLYARNVLTFRNILTDERYDSMLRLSQFIKHGFKVVI